MKNGSIEAQIYIDSDTPNLSTEPVEEGMAIVRTIAPWIRLNRRVGEIGFSEPDYISGEEIQWVKFDSDINIVLTEKRIVGGDQLHRDGKINVRKLNQGVQYIGWAYDKRRANSNRVALVNTSAIKNTHHVVAHEIAHLFGVEQPTYDAHCLAINCIMNAFLPEKGRKERTFCETDTELLHQNADRLRMYKAGKLALAPNARIY
jgi:hypothetical protein